MQILNYFASALKRAFGNITDAPEPVSLGSVVPADITGLYRWVLFYDPTANSGSLIHGGRRTNSVQRLIREGKMRPFVGYGFVDENLSVRFLPNDCYVTFLDECMSWTHLLVFKGNMPYTKVLANTRKGCLVMTLVQQFESSNDPKYASFDVATLQNLKDMPEELQSVVLGLIALRRSEKKA